LKKIKIKELDHKSFSGYGDFTNALNPSGFKLGEPPAEFFRDIIGFNPGSNKNVSFSVFRGLRQSGAKILSAVEFHSSCPEIQIPLDGDYVLCFGKATPPGQVPLDEIEAFRIPKGTLIIMKPGVWHGGLFLYNCDIATILVSLPERTYADDCIVHVIAEKERVEIEGEF
jgi:ureidoglycolate hydrolase